MRSNTYFTISKVMFLVPLLQLSIWGCNNSEELKETTEDVVVDTTASKFIDMGEVRIIIPSPIQTAILVKDVGAPYEPTILNPNENHTGYSTNYEKALNLGVYGADLGYSTIFEHSKSSFLSLWGLFLAIMTVASKYRIVINNFCYILCVKGVTI